MALLETYDKHYTATSTNVLWIRNCRHPLGGLAVGGRYCERRADVMAIILKVWYHIKNPTQTIDARLQCTWKTIV